MLVRKTQNCMIQNDYITTQFHRQTHHKFVDVPFCLSKQPIPLIQQWYALSISFRRFFMGYQMLTSHDISRARFVVSSKQHFMSSWSCITEINASTLGRVILDNSAWAWTSYCGRIFFFVPRLYSRQIVTRYEISSWIHSPYETNPGNEEILLVWAQLFSTLIQSVEHTDTRWSQ